MTQGFRIYLLVFSSIMAVFFYRVTQIATVFQAWCWQYYEVWLLKINGLNMYDAFSLLFLVHFLWLLVEVALSLKNKISRIPNLSILGAVLALLIAVSWAHSRHADFLRFYPLQASNDAKWFEKEMFNPKWKLGLEQRFIPPPERLPYPPLHVYMRQQTCKNNMTKYDLTREQLDNLYQKYENEVVPWH